MDPETDRPSATAEAFPERPCIKVVRSQELFAGKREVLIEHSGSIYRLRMTRAGKLILNK